MKPIVVKIGGSTLGREDTTLEDLVTLQHRGVPLVVVHGGGRLISHWQSKLRIAASFVRGERVTDAQSLEVVVAVLAGLVNKELVARVNGLGGRAMGLSGADCGIIEARVKNPELGRVGEVVGINTAPLEILLEAGYIPFLAPVGLQYGGRRGPEAPLLNINSDIVAGEVARALGAERLIFLTDVAGVLDSQGGLIPHLSPGQARDLIDSGTAVAGMIPKLEASLRAVERVEVACIIDGRVPRALLQELEGEMAGTTIRGDR
ncbi:MAG TPA: acetylglutamate kinase [Dehalococcoidia bacterium]|jgi:acetylglutamate kinase|nr:acetylglutamate kinase [Dehalococcoidia bacterium]